jgi:LacI family transcriptional regulator
VSKSTVSLVLQGSPTVRAETAAHVRATMAEVGYVYNRAAAALRSTSAGLVGLVINDLRNPFFTEFAATAQMALSARGYATVLANTDEDPGLQHQVVGSMIEHGVAALVLSPAYGETRATFDLIARAGLPAVQVLRRADARDELFPFTSFDYEAGGREAAAHLLAMGARAIAFVGGEPGRAITQERQAGCLAVLRAAGRVPLLLPGPPTRAFGEAAADRLAAEHPEVDAAICFNDLTALGLLTGCARIGRGVGRDFRVVGFDDIEECALAWPRLSSVSCDIAPFARRTAETVLAWLEEGTRPPGERRAPVHLVARASSTGETTEGTPDKTTGATPGLAPGPETGGMATGGTATDGTSKDRTAPDETAPDETAKGRTAEGETAPDETAPGGTAEGETAPDETAEGETAESETAKGEPTRGDAATGGGPAAP